MFAVCVGLYAFTVCIKASKRIISNILEILCDTTDSGYFQFSKVFKWNSYDHTNPNLFLFPVLLSCLSSFKHNSSSPFLFFFYIIFILSSSALAMLILHCCLSSFLHPSPSLCPCFLFMFYS